MKIIWTKRAQKRFRDRQSWVAQESCSRKIAFEWGRRITDEVAQLYDFPRIGRIVPEINRENIREIIVDQTTRVIYKVQKTACSILYVRRVRKSVRSL